VSDVDQPFGNGAAHAAQPRNSDLHDVSSSFSLSVNIRSAMRMTAVTYIR